MRKLTILLAAAALAASNTGCVGRCKNWFHKGSPCGTLMTAPAMLSAPIAMGAPMAGPVMQPNFCCEQQGPIMCMPCDPCDPCAAATTVGTSGYIGGYMQNAADCPCDANGVPIGTSAGTIPDGGIIPGP